MRGPQRARRGRARPRRPIPDPADVIKYMYTDTAADDGAGGVRARSRSSRKRPRSSATDGELTYRDAIKEALFEEMLRDRRVIFYGEDVADYGGAFKATKGLLEAFGRRARVQHADLRGRASAARPSARPWSGCGRSPS